MGWDAFGLPAERAAMREGIHPAIITQTNINNFRGQIKRLGFSYDWDREVDTSSPEYYRWTQWIFLKLYEKGLAYLAESPVNWCPALGTVLANEEVKDGFYVETGDPVERRVMKQWTLKITAYAERLLEDLESLDWPESVKQMQRNWIGKSEGAQLSFSVDGHSSSFEVFTTRPDTLFGATFCVLAPEHPIVKEIVSNEQQEQVNQYVYKASQKTDLDRTDVQEKTGVFTGAYAINPVNQKKIPIWIADYVMMSYGTGAIMAVPGHDERDHEFAKKMGLEIIQVVSSPNSIDIQKEAYVGDGKLIQSGFLEGLDVATAKEKMIVDLENKNLGKRKVNYKLRDWLFSRQRYWGEPFPLIHLEDGSVVPVPESDLPVSLPPVDEYKPTEDGEPPLARAPGDWKEVTLSDGRKGRREYNTMPQWAGSCWYYLRYIDPKNTENPFDPELEKYWMPVDLYIGGVEHAVLHLLYSRFWHKVLFDCGLVSTKEPFQGLFNQGMILAYSHQDAQGKYYHPSEVESDGKIYRSKDKGEELRSQVEKMSKSKRNVVNPDEVVETYGADSLRLYEMFMGPLDASKPWQMDGVDGVHRFLARCWRLVVDENTGNLQSKLTDSDPSSEIELLKTLHRTIKKVQEDTEGLRMNTAISQMMIFVNAATSAKTLPRSIAKTFLQVLAPYAPHIAEELWQKLGEDGFICKQPWPSYDEELCTENEITLAVMVNGKRRSEITVSKEVTQDHAVEKATQDPKVSSHLEGKEIKKVIFVPGKLVNLIAK